MSKDARQLYVKYAGQITNERAQELRDYDLQIIEAPRVLSDFQLTALDLYERGLNVFPIRYQDKRPYILKPLFIARLHHCNARCTHRGVYDITVLFGRDNIAVMTGRTSCNLIAVDCDSHTVFEQISKELTARAIPFWAIKGKRGGTYLLRIMEGEVQNADKTTIKDVQIWGNRHLIVLPPSIHPDGKMYRWATPEPRYHLPRGEGVPMVSNRALDWLGVTLAKSTKRWQDPDLYGLEDWAGVLSLKSRETFAGIGISEGNRNTSLFSLLCEMKANGREYWEAEQIALDYARRVGLSNREAVDTLKSAYNQDRTTPAEYYGGEKPESQRARGWHRAQVFADSFDWRGKFGRKAQTRRACYMACIERARLDGRIHWRATVREIAELMQTNAVKAGCYLKELVAAGLIKRTGYKDGSIYRFLRLSEVDTVRTTGRCSVSNLDFPKTQGEQDVFGRLGLNAWYVWRYLLTHEVRTVAQIVRETDLPRSSIYAALKVLQDKDVRLVSSAEGVLYAEPRTEASLQSMALSWNNGASPSRARKERHTLDREISAFQRVSKARAYKLGQHD